MNSKYKRDALERGGSASGGDHPGIHGHLPATLCWPAGPGKVEGGREDPG